MRKPVITNNLELPYTIDEFGNIFNSKGVKMKSRLDKQGYEVIILTVNYIRYNRKVHRLVMQAFTGFNILDVNHIDGNKKNNHLSNLEYCSRKYNIDHAYKLGLMKPHIGLKRGNSKMTDDDIKYIRTSTKSISVLASEYKKTYQCIWKIVKGRSF